MPGLIGAIMFARHGIHVVLAAVLVVGALGGGCRSDSDGESNSSARTMPTYNPPPQQARSAPLAADPNTATQPRVNHRPLPARLRQELIAVRQKVGRAANYLAERGEQVLPEFDDPNSRWGRSPYVFVWTIQGVCLAHPINGNLVGKNLMGLTDTHGNNFAVEFARIATNEARNNRGWCEYWWNPPESSQSRHKVSFIQRVPGRTWLVGAGLYVDDVSARRVRRDLSDPNGESGQ
jgi:hypothetical protein